MTTDVRSTSKARSATTGKRRDLILLLGGAALLLVVVGLDVAVATRGPAEEGPPIFSVTYTLRMMFLAVGSAAFVVGIHAAACRLLAPVDRLMNGVGAGVNVRVAAAVGVIPALASIVLVVGDPGLLSRLVREDQVVEWLSALLAFLAAAAFGTAAHRAGHQGVAIRLVLVAMTAGCLLLGLEEISWFQRVFGVESPDFMVSRNAQQETNLHNLATGATENLYYVGGFVYLILVPITVGDRRLPDRFAWLQTFVPSRVALLGSATAAGFVYAMWNIAWIQATFWMTLAALVVAARDRVDRRLALGLAVLTAVTAVAFLLAGDSMVRDWDDTEIRELVIPYGLLLAGLEAMRRAPTSVRPATSR